MSQINQFTLLLVFIALALAYTFGGNKAGLFIFSAMLVIYARFFFKRALNLLLVWWLKLGFLLGRIINPIVLSIIFVVVVTPIGLLLRSNSNKLFRQSKNAASYYKPSDEIDGETYFNNQF